MRYIRPREYPLNPRAPIDLLDEVVECFQHSRRTFTEEEALTAVWACGEDMRLREDPRFWEIAGCGHFHLAHHRLANRQLADRLWQGLWDGHNLDAEIEKLDAAEPGTFHVFCEADPYIRLESSSYFLVARAKTSCPPELAARLGGLRITLLETHRSLSTPHTTRELLDMAIRLDEDIAESEDALDHFEGWLSNAEEWTGIARGLWLPSELVPQPEPPRPFRVRPIQGSHSWQHGNGVTEIVEADESSLGAVAENRLVLPDPPVERDPDASVRWIHTLRTIHLHFAYLPVPTGARFRYPRFVGRMGPLAIPTVIHETGQEGFVWLDREHHRFFGDFLRAAIEWDEAGRRLHLCWSPEAVVITHGELDNEVHEEERRFLDPEDLYDLRLGKGESYRQSLAQILREQVAGMPFRSLYEALAVRLGHRPSRASIRAVLSASPEFAMHGNSWRWQSVPDSARSFRRTMVLSSIGHDINTVTPDLHSLAHVARLRATHLAEPQNQISSPPHISLGEETSPEPSSRIRILPYRGEHTPPPKTVPLIPLRIAAGGFSAGAEAPEPEGWVTVERRGRLEEMFAAYVSGRSMEPLIPDGALCLFRRNPTGTRQGRIVLVQDRRIVDPDTGGSFTVKRYHRVTEITDEQSREGVVVHLLPENQDYTPIVLANVPEGDVVVVAEFVEVLSGFANS
jgi:SOS-response transcriptional repressor LexA